MEFLTRIVASLKPAKDITCVLSGLAGGVITYLYGGWSVGLETLAFFIIVDCFTGIIGALVFKKSLKTKKGGLSSEVGEKGIWTKVGICIAVACMHRVDITMDSDFFMNAAIIGFIANEFISIIENLGKNWGVKFPPVVTKAIDVLNTKAKDAGKD